jgi:phytoene desaturase
VHFALEGSWPGIPHTMTLMPTRYETLLNDIFEYGVLPQDAIIMLSHPTVADPSLAPEGKSLFSAAVPVANQGKLPIDWDQVGPLLEARVLNEIGRRLVPDIHDRIITKFHVTPRDSALDFNAHLGSGWGLEATRLQDWFVRPANRDPKLANFYLVGAGTHPGAGLPAVLAGAKATAQLVLEDLR